MANPTVRHLTTTDELHKEHLVIIKKLEEIERRQVATWMEIQKLFAAGAGQVTPELEQAVQLVAKRAIAIDQKVPDRQVPPGAKPPQLEVLVWDAKTKTFVPDQPH